VLVEHVRSDAELQGEVDLIDGSYGIRETTSSANFASIWTGYYLAPSRLRYGVLFRRGLGVLIGLLVGSAWFFRRGRQAPSRWRTREKGIVGVSMIAVLIAPAFNGSALATETAPAVHNPYDFRDGTWRAWRGPERDAVNALYFLLRFCGSDGTYQDVQEALGGDDRKRSMLELRDAARDLGVEAAVYRGSPASLDSLRVPVVAHIEGVEFGSGGFSVILPNRNGDELIVVDGQTAQFTSVKQDELRRAWNGVMLVPTTESLPYYWMFAACTLLSLLAVRVWVGRRVEPSMKATNDLRHSVQERADSEVAREES
jgi:peptidase C39-like protein